MQEGVLAYYSCEQAKHPYAEVLRVETHELPDRPALWLGGNFGSRCGRLLIKSARGLGPTLLPPERGLYRLRWSVKTHMD